MPGFKLMGFGLLGVFVVLTLFYFLIKILIVLFNKEKKN